VNPTARRPLLATLFVLAAIALILVSLLRGHPIDKRDLGDLYGCYSVEGRTLFRLTPDALVSPTSKIAFTAHQGRRHAYLDLASPMRLAHRGDVQTFDPAPEPTGPIEVRRSTPRALLLPSDAGPPIEAIRTECRL
jgi:hypothetical protein